MNDHRFLGRAIMALAWHGAGRVMTTIARYFISSRFGTKVVCGRWARIHAHLNVVFDQPGARMESATL